MGKNVKENNKVLIPQKRFEKLQQMLWFSLAEIKGEVIVVTDKSGARYCGILDTVKFNPDVGDLTITLKFAQRLNEGEHDPNTRNLNDFHEHLEINNISSFYAYGIDHQNEKQKDKINSKLEANHGLTKINDENVSQVLLNKNQNPTTQNQFEENRLNIQSTQKQENNTTESDKRARIHQTKGEIENLSKRNQLLDSHVPENQDKKIIANQTLNEANTESLTQSSTDQKNSTLTSDKSDEKIGHQNGESATLSTTNIVNNSLAPNLQTAINSLPSSLAPQLNQLSLPQQDKLSLEAEKRVQFNSSQLPLQSQLQLPTQLPTDLNNLSFPQLQWINNLQFPQNSNLFNMMNQGPQQINMIPPFFVQPPMYFPTIDFFNNEYPQLSPVYNQSFFPSQQLPQSQPQILPPNLQSKINFNTQLNDPNQPISLIENPIKNLNPEAKEFTPSFGIQSQSQSQSQIPQQSQLPQPSQPSSNPILTPFISFPNTPIIGNNIINMDINQSGPFQQQQQSQLSPNFIFPSSTFIPINEHNFMQQNSASNYSFLLPQQQQQQQLQPSPIPNIQLQSQNFQPVSSTTTSSNSIQNNSHNSNNNNKQS